MVLNDKLIGKCGKLKKRAGIAKIVAYCKTIAISGHINIHVYILTKGLDIVKM
jgi:hypothetical protein